MIRKITINYEALARAGVSGREALHAYAEDVARIAGWDNPSGGFLCNDPNTYSWTYIERDPGQEGFPEEAAQTKYYHGVCVDGPRLGSWYSCEDPWKEFYTAIPRDPGMPGSLDANGMYHSPTIKTRVDTYDFVKGVFMHPDGSYYGVGVWSCIYGPEEFIENYARPWEVAMNLLMQATWPDLPGESVESVDDIVDRWIQRQAS